MARDIIARLFDDDTNFYFRRPVWSLNVPVFTSLTRHKVVNTNKGYHFTPLAASPATATLTGVYTPIAKVIGVESSHWTDRLPRIGTIKWNGLRDLTRMEGTTKTLRWAGEDWGPYFVSSITLTPSGQEISEYPGEQYDESEGAYPQFVDFTVRLIATAPDGGRLL